MNKKIITFVIIMFAFVPYCVKATTLQDLYDDLANLESSYSAAKNKANMTQAEINKIRASISTIENEIVQAQNDIEQAEKDIKKSEDEIAKRKEETNLMLRYLQIANSKGSSMIEYIFEADDYTDLIYRYSVVTQLSEANKKLMDELTRLISELETKKANLKAKQVELSNKKKELQNKTASLLVQLQKENDTGLNISEQIAAKKKNINYYESIGCKRSSDITQCNGIPAVTGWNYPLYHFKQSSNYGWDENRYHYAVDLGTGEGSTVMAVGPGKVIFAGTVGYKASCYSSYTNQYYSDCHCGGYVIQILHSYQGQEYVSLYMHLLTSNVGYGSKVSGGQPIGTSGGGYQEISKWHDHCTYGGHLHFTMSRGSSLIGSSGVKGNTFNPKVFFPTMWGIGATL